MGQFGLHGKHLVGQPFLQRKIIGIGTQECHGRMGVGIFKSRHYQIMASIDLPVPHRRTALLRHLPHAGEDPVLNPEFPVRQRAPPLSSSKSLHDKSGYS